MRDAGFDHAWALPYAHKAGVAAAINEWSAEVAACHPELRSRSAAVGPVMNAMNALAASRALVLATTAVE